MFLFLEKKICMCNQQVGDGVIKPSPRNGHGQRGHLHRLQEEFGGFEEFDGFFRFPNLVFR